MLCGLWDLSSPCRGSSLSSQVRGLGAWWLVTWVTGWYCAQLRSCVRFCATPPPPKTGTCQSPLSLEFSRQEYWNGLPVLEPVGWFLLQGIFPTQGLSPYLLRPLHWEAGSLPLAPSGKPHAGIKRAQQSHLGCSPGRGVWEHPFN